MNFRYLSVGLLGLASALSVGQTNRLTVDVGYQRTRDDARYAAGAAAREFTQRVAALTKLSRSRFWRGDTPFSMPVRVEYTSFGQPIVSPKTPGKRADDITLTFDSSGETAFPESYRQALQAVYASAKPVMDAVFGPTALGGSIHVVNYDNNIFDRQSVSGGIYVPDNGSGERQILFPVYNSPEAAAVNFIHCLLLAYQGAQPYKYDAFQEGLVRAATARIVRTGGALVGYNAASIEQVLYNTYEVQGYYDWYNQKALGGAAFVAPNLVKAPVPTGGSYGGLYLLRYRMAGEVWEKVLAEYPTFVKELNAKLAANPAIGADVNGLVSAGQAILAANRPTAPTVEGLSFADWFRRQYILQTANTRGSKLLMQVTPIQSGLSGSDYGVFNIEANYFSRDAAGNETLLSATAYPIFWDPAFNFRLFPSAQEDRMDIAGAYGSVGPNFTNDFGGKPYRITLDLPVLDQIGRSYLPVGAIATPSTQSAPNNVFGTLTGAEDSGAVYTVRIRRGNTVLANLVANLSAFGGRLAPVDVAGPASWTVQVFKTVGQGLEQLVYERQVNKGPGDLALDIRLDEERSYNLASALPAGLFPLGLPFTPVDSGTPQVLNESAANMMLARYNPSKLKYELYPDFEAESAGQGFYHRLPSANTATVTGRRSILPTSVALKPGWNLIATPFDAATTLATATVSVGAENPQTYALSISKTLGVDVFQFNVGPKDPISGVPETGTLEPVSEMQPFRAYWIQCLSPNGATLTFPVPQGQSPNRAMAKPGAFVAPALRWKVDITATGSGVKSSLTLGMSKTASEGFDAKEDSFMPPRMGGFQLMSVNGSEYYRDIRPFQPARTYSVNLDGLRKGQKYKLTFQQNQFPCGTLIVTDSTGKKQVSLYAYGTYEFTAVQTTHKFTVRIQGAK